MIDRIRDFIQHRGQSYRRTFATEPAKRVLADLAWFCRANHTTFVPGDLHASAVAEGRREVWLRIQQHLQMTPEELYAYHRREADERKPPAESRG